MAYQRFSYDTIWERIPCNKKVIEPVYPGKMRSLPLGTVRRMVQTLYAPHTSMFAASPYEEDHQELDNLRNEISDPPKVKKLADFQFHFFSKCDESPECYKDWL